MCFEASFLDFKSRNQTFSLDYKCTTNTKEDYMNNLVRTRRSVGSSDVLQEVKSPNRQSFRECVESAMRNSRKLDRVSC